ncbi:MAG: pilus assembly PilX family protein [Steroidobacteraceae bacterium]
MIKFGHGRGIQGYSRRRQQGAVLFVALILLLILTLLGVGLARNETTEERLAQNDNNHQLALQTAEAALQAAFDDDVDGLFTDFSGATPGLNALSNELSTPPFTTLGYNADWSAPGVNTILYDGAPLASAPPTSTPQFVLEAMVPAVPPGCSAGNAGLYGGGVTIHRITAHAAGGDGTASATVQTLHVGGC